MHAFRKGLIEHVTFLVLDNVPASRKDALDTLAVQFHQQHRQMYRSRYPATDFSRGVTNLTKVAARKRLGLEFLFVKKVVEVFEALLCFDAWLMQDTFWDSSSIAMAMQSARSSIETLLKLCN
jgi:hypothetical protein